MNMKREWVYLHLAVLLYGLTGILGRLISLDEVSLVWWRMTITLCSLFALPGILNKARSLPPKARKQALGIGFIVALHWLSFFGAIKLSNVSVTLSCIASVAFFTSLIEPLLLRRPYRWRESLFGLTTVGGLSMIYGFVGHHMYAGMLMALFSALLAAIFGTLNKHMVERHDVYAVTLYEFISGVGLMSLVTGAMRWQDPHYTWLPQGWDWLWLLILALACTTLAFILTMHALRKLSAFATALVINLEPVYSILLAAAIFYEHKELNAGFYLGALVIVGAVLAHGVMSKERA